MATALYRIRNPRQIAALATPARQEIVDGLQALGPCSVAQLAHSLGRAPDSLYYHLRKLEAVGLVIACAAQAGLGREEAFYKTPGRMVLDFQPQGPAQRQSLLRLIAAALRAAQRDLQEALAGGLARYKRGRGRNAWGARTQAWLDARELATVQEHLLAIHEIFAAGRRRPDAAQHALTFVLTPLVSRERDSSAVPPKPQP